MCIRDSVIPTVTLGIGLTDSGEGPCLHLAVIRSKRLGHGLTHRRKTPHELGYLIPIQAQHVLPDQDLAVAARSGADADGDDVQLPGNQGGQLGGHALQHHGKGSRSLDGQRVGQQGGSPVLPLALDLEASEGVVRLGGHPDVGAHRDALSLIHI